MTNMWARIEGDRVAEITDIDPEGRFHHSLMWVYAGESDVQVGWNYNDKTDSFTPPEIKVTPLQVHSDAAMAQVNAEYTKRMGAIADDYPLYERESWSVQMQEARDVQANPDAPTPWLDACARQRGMDKLELAQRILAKDTDYRRVSGFLTGVRQGHEDCITLLLEEEDRESLERYDYKQGWIPLEAVEDVNGRIQ